MLRNSFIFLDRISHQSEVNIWAQGIHTWSDFINTPCIRGIGDKRKAHYNRFLEKAKTALINNNSSFFTDFPSTETWRLYDFFGDDTVFLDIETANSRGNISMITLSDGDNAKTLVRGFNLDRQNLKKAFADHAMIVTFNGSSYDIPWIKKYFGDIIPNIPHLDLRHVLSRLGYTGGLKKIERTLNIRREKCVEHLHGSDAAQLYRLFRFHKDEHFLKLLLKYNEEDAQNLKNLADFVCNGLKQQLRHHFVFSRREK